MTTPLIYAHRGFHNDKYPENSIGAFINAVNHNLPIELDVRITKDRIPIVFHDDSLFRMTEIHSKLSKTDFSEINKLTLKDTDETIPLFKDVLEIIDGKVPLLIEIKLNKFDLSGQTENAVLNVLKNYSGNYSIQSFNKYCVNRMKYKLKNTNCGILSSDKYLTYPVADFINYKLIELNSERISNLRKKYNSVFAWSLAEMSVSEAKTTAENFKIDALVCNIK